MAFIQTHEQVYSQCHMQSKISNDSLSEEQAMIFFSTFLDDPEDCWPIASKFLLDHQHIGSDSFISRFSLEVHIYNPIP